MTVIKRELNFKSTNGVNKIHSVVWMPQEAPVRAILQISHGMVEYIERYDEFAVTLAEAGYLVVGDDHLGHGQSVEQESDWGYMSDGDGFSQIVEDMHRLYKAIHRKYPKLPYFLLGHSMGSFLSREFVLRYGDVLDGAVFMGTGYNPTWKMAFGVLVTRIMAMFKGWHYRSNFVDNMGGGSFNKAFEPVKTKSDWLTKDEQIISDYINEPRCQFIFTISAYHDLCKGIIHMNQGEKALTIPKSLPILFVSGDKDPVGDFGKGVSKSYEIYKAAGIEDVTLKLFKDDRHEILNELDRQDVYAYIKNWLDAHIS